MQVRNLGEADGCANCVAEWEKLRFQRRPEREAEELAGEFTPAVDRFEPPAGMRFVLVFLAFLAGGHSAESGLDYAGFEIGARLRFERSKVLVGDAEAIGQSAQANAGFFASGVGDERFQLVVGDDGDDVLFDAERRPAEEQCAELRVKLGPARGMFAFVVGEAAEPQAAGREGFQDAERRLMPAAIADMHAMLLERGAERALKDGRGKSEFGRAFRYDGEARQEGFRIGLAVLRDARRRILSAGRSTELSSTARNRAERPAALRRPIAIPRTTSQTECRRAIDGARPVTSRNLRRTPMPGKQAKVVTPPMLKRMLRYVSRSSFPTRDRAMILLSIKAGLRACEIAGLDWSMNSIPGAGCPARSTSAT